MADTVARKRALHDHGHSLLVEAGAGTGKTTLLAGRIAMLVAAGAKPRHIAAITFTEKAAAELKSRVYRYLRALATGTPPSDLAPLLKLPLDTRQLAQLEASLPALAELTVCTIHAFCQQLIRPYPVEAGVDPGASVLDANHGVLARERLLEAFLTQALSQAARFPFITALFRHDLRGALGTLSRMAEARAARRAIAPHATDAGPLDAELDALRSAVEAFCAWQSACVAEGLVVPDAQAFADQWARGLDAYRAALDDGISADALVALALNIPDALPLTKTSTPRVWQLRGKWQTVWRGVHGRSKTEANAEGGALSDAGKQLYDSAGERWSELHDRISGLAADGLMSELQGFLDQYASQKGARAQLDFDDLLLTACRLLATRPAVRAALATRYQHVLVDEFQDTDPLQVEILWLLCGDGDPAAGWHAQTLRPGALFCVGDPKQAVYRFRGADINSYQAARDAIEGSPQGARVLITTNFRSDEPIIRWVNTAFEGPLSAARQPGFTHLVACTPRRDEAPDVNVRSLPLVSDGPLREDDERGRDALRDQEAAQVATLCSRLIGHLGITGKEGHRPLAPRDIALLTQTGTELWRYEDALERAGIPIVSQAGKGFFHRQEVQDLINLTRVLAEPRDTLALGAFLRGPCVGLTDQALLDITQALARATPATRKPVLRLWTPLEDIGNPLAQAVLEQLQSLARRARRTTPYRLLAEAVDALQLRAVLIDRHRRSPERALGNVERFLELARPWDSAGLRAFACYLRSRWEDAESEVEARADLQENAVQLLTAHSAKGLEWPVVVLINSFTSTNNKTDPVLFKREPPALVAKLGALPSGLYVSLRDNEKEELARERVRLLYVACTRAKHLLILPLMDPATASWLSKADVHVDPGTRLDPSENAANYPLPHWTGAPPAAADEDPPVNLQTAAAFEDESALIAQRSPRLVWHRPSLHEGAEALAAPPLIDAVLPDELPASGIVGGTERGNTLHLLMEELVAGLLAGAPAAIRARAAALIAQADPTQTLDPEEITQTVCRTLQLPAVARYWGHLQAEFTTFASQIVHGEEILTRGIADALAFDEQGQITAVFDWKSDVAPSAEVRHRYRAQVRDYLEATGAREGFVVYMTPGEVDVVSA